MKKKKKVAKKAGTSPAAKKSSRSMVPYGEVNEIVDFLERRGLEEFEFERGGIRIRIKRQSSVTVAAPVMAAQTAPAASAQSSRGSSATEPSPSDLGDLHIIKSPIVGTFYGAPNPDVAPYVNVGDKVKAGQVLCIIEAMKLMNEIESDIAGEVVQIFGENAQPVEYGESLFAVRPA